MKKASLAGKLHRGLFLTLITLLPVQLGRHFWPEWTYVLGLRIDYLAPTIYLTDLLLVGIVGLWFWENRKQLTINKQFLAIKQYWWVIVVFFYLLVNSFLAQNPGVAFYKFFKIIEFTLLGFYLARTKVRMASLVPYLSLGVIYSSLMAIGQFVWQHSLGGPFWWLGERTFNAFTPGIAEAVLGGRLMMRPYATFPHPNVLAGFILVSLILIVMNRQEGQFKKTVKWLVMGLGIVTLVVSFSRSVWLVGLLSLFFIGYYFFPKKKYYLTVSLIGLLCLAGLLYFTPQLSTEEAFSQRLQLGKAAVDMAKTAPMMGVGLNNFLVRLPDFWQAPKTVRSLQPVHNLFLLVVAETGLTGLLFFLWLLILTYKRLLFTGQKSLFLVLSAILALGLLDHYWLTLQQTQLLLTVVFGLSWGTKKG